MRRGVTEVKGKEVERRRVRIEQTKKKKVFHVTLMGGFVGMRVMNGKCKI